jgi:hypothetical protein
MYSEICDEGARYRCINDWFDGTTVAKYNSGVTNDAYELQPVDRCRSGSFYSTANCPISGIPAGYEILQIRDRRKSNACVGTPAGTKNGAYASETGCNSTSYPGTGGGYGTIVVLAAGLGCQSGNFVLVDAFWTNAFGGNWSNLAEVQGYDQSGSQVYMAYLNANWCWGYTVL